MSVQNIAAKKTAETYKAIFVPNRQEGETTQDEILLEVGTHAECNAALQNHESNALKRQGPFQLSKGHFALLVADERLIARKAEIRENVQRLANPQAAPAEKPAKPEKPAKAEKPAPADPMAGE